MKHTQILTKLTLLLALSCLLLLAVSLPALAQEPNFDQVNRIAKQLNCPTCAGINLADCRTQTCAQWREQISDLLKEGYTEPEVLDYFVTQYGVQVLQEPPKSGLTLSLWLLPILLLLAGAVWLFYTMRGWAAKNPEPAPVSAAIPTQPSSNNRSAAGAAATDDDYLSLVEQDLEA